MQCVEDHISMLKPNILATMQDPLPFSPELHKRLKELVAECKAATGNRANQYPEIDGYFLTIQNLVERLERSENARKEAPQAGEKRKHCKLYTEDQERAHRELCAKFIQDKLEPCDGGFVSSQQIRDAFSRDQDATMKPDTFFKTFKGVITDTHSVRRVKSPCMGNVGLKWK